MPHINFLQKIQIHLWDIILVYMVINTNIFSKPGGSPWSSVDHTGLVTEKSSVQIPLEEEKKLHLSDSSFGENL